VTLLGLAGGEFLPLPRSKGAAFPSCSPATGSPPLPLISLKDEMLSQKFQETTERQRSTGTSLLEDEYSMSLRVCLEVKDITKLFPGVVANDQVSLSLVEGKMYALVGENGAGKSTLLKMIFGLSRPDSGKILLDGHSIEENSPQKAIDKGIGLVTQDLSLIPTFNPVENTAIQMEFSKKVFLDLAESGRRLNEKSTDLGFKLDFRKKTVETPLEDCQKIEVLRRLVTNVRLLILDEPSSMLTPIEEEQMLFSIRTLVDKFNLTVLFTTHKFQNLLKYPDELIVMRKGKVVLFSKIENLSMNEIIKAVTGEELTARNKIDGVEEKKRPLMQIQNLSSVDDEGTLSLKHINLEVHTGEIVGIVGTAFSGKDALAKLILGTRKVIEGSVAVDGEDITNKRTKYILNKGISYIPKDNRFALASDLSVAENLVLNRIYNEPFCKNFIINFEAIRDLAKRAVREFKIMTPSIHTPVNLLSGGNQRKVIVARELTKESKLLIAEDPTIGLDIRAAQEILNYLTDFRNRGGGVVLISEDLAELMSCADLIYILYEKEIFKVLRAAEATLEKLGGYMLGMEIDGNAPEIQK
jgi:simple sugar transport system ATP-binding protein